MFIKLLSESDKEFFLYMAEILSLSDDPLLWDGKTKEEITSATNLDELSFQRNKLEITLLTELANEGGKSWRDISGAEEIFLEKLKAFPLQKIGTPEVRIQAATYILKKLLKEQKCENPSVPKLMLFELMLLALHDGNISNIEWALLKEFQYHHKLEDFIFNDILERAETINREINKTLSIILE